ncbi:ATP synthase subunit I [Sideroxydans lithotrophicus]|uniref:ATP synthase subunit I n=1 Tax=Sideroxydans lithotrophicus TaxID=63745 RepID=UPI0001B0E2FA|nr:ATP synthase subunit I [Sideroxydans lithotrophicus]
MIIWKSFSVDSGAAVKNHGSGKKDAEQRLTPPLNAAIIAALFRAEVQEKRFARKVIALQTLATLVATGLTAVCWKSSPQYAIAALGGGGISVLNGALLAWRMSRAALHSAHDAHQQLRLMYFYAAERFLAVVALLGICLVVLKLSPLAVLGGFVLGQTVLLAARLLMKIKFEDSD